MLEQLWEERAADEVPKPVLCAIGNSEEFPIAQKGTNVPEMRTRAKMQVVASDRAKRTNGVEIRR